MVKLLSDLVHGDTSKVSKGSKTSTRIGCRFAGATVSGVQGRYAICSPFKFNGTELVNRFLEITRARAYRRCPLLRRRPDC